MFSFLFLFIQDRVNIMCSVAAVHFQSLYSGTCPNYEHLCYTLSLFFFLFGLDYLALTLKHIIF